MDLDPATVELVVDAANVVGARPDGWWRDRAAAATRLVQALATLPGAVLPDPDGAAPSVRVGRVHAVVEGQARVIPQVSGVVLVRAAADGDTAVVAACRSVLDDGGVPLAVTADRGLRARLPEGTVVAGPRWLLGVLDGPGVGGGGGLGGGRGGGLGGGAGRGGGDQSRKPGSDGGIATSS